MNTIVNFNVISDVGCVRSNNEDMAFVAGQLIRDNSDVGQVSVENSAVGFAVADGMGGYEGGEVASEIVCRSLGWFLNDFAPASDAQAINSLKKWAVEANRMVSQTAAMRPGLAEMGTTFVGIVFYPVGAALINVGDSRCYRIRGGILKQLTVDHSERNRTRNPDVPSNIIYNYMGAPENSFISDITILSTLPGDIYILCSDGLSDLVDDDAIEAANGNPADLVAMAKTAGGRDNITVLTLAV